MKTMLSAGGGSSLKGRNPGSPARASEDAGALPIFKSQLAAYVAWVNAQLKKKPGAHLVEDLRHDIRDGVALVDLVEIIGGEKLEGVHSAPSNYSEMRDNVEKVLHFMTVNHIKMHHITTRDIIEGNLKAIMRLVLALAAHYKPHSVRHSAQMTARQNIAGIAQGASAALTEARRHATKAGYRHRRRRHKEDHRGSHSISGPSDVGQGPTLCQNCRTSISVANSSVQPNKTATHHRLGQPSQRHPGGMLREDVEGEEGGRAELEGASGSSSPVNNFSTSPRMSLYLSDPPSSMEGLLMSGGALMSASCESDSLTDSGFVELCDSVKETHKALLNLHDLLLNGDTASNNGAPDPLEGSNSQEKMIVLNERLLHAEEMISALKADLNKTKKDCMELQGTKVGLEQCLADKESQLANAKAELMKFELDKQNRLLETDSLKKQLADREQVLSDIKVSFVKQTEDKERMLADLRKEVLKRDQSLEVLREKLSCNDKSYREVPGSDGAQNYKVPSAQGVGRLDLFVKQVAESRPSQMSGLRAVRDSLAQMRSSMPYQGSGTTESLDSLEENVVRLFEGLGLNGHVPGDTSIQNGTGRGGLRTQTMRTSTSLRDSNQKTPVRGSAPNRGRGRAKPITPARSVQPTSVRPTEVTPRPTRFSNAPRGASQPSGGRSQIPLPNGGRSRNPTATSQDNQTQVVYYMESNDKPYSCNVHKRLGEITLRDFKNLIEDSECYHFYFKVLDPEYGTVKEELSCDDDVLPGWEGRIVAWLEEESVTV